MKTCWQHGVKAGNRLFLF